MVSESLGLDTNDIVFRLLKRAEIRRSIATRKSVMEGKPDRIADLLEEAADVILTLRNSTMGIVCRLEDDLIHPDKWDELYDEMPQECKDVVDGPPDCVGIGRNSKYGWFIMCSGQGPGLCWCQNNE